MRIFAKISDRLAAIRMRQSDLERRVGLPANRISKWRGGQGEPTARQALAIARVLGVSLEWLADEDAAGDPPGATPDPLTPEEQALVGLYRGSGLTLEEAARRLIRPTPGQAAHRRQPG